MIKKLEFIEQYIDTKPTENYWRGINAICDGINVFDIHYNEKNHRFDDESHFFIKSIFFPSYILVNYDNSINFDEISKLYYSKEEVKEATQILFEKYINLFIL